MLALGRCEKEKREGEKTGRGERDKWAEPETGRGRDEPFPFSKFIFCSNLLKGFLKSF